MYMETVDPFPRVCTDIYKILPEKCITLVSLRPSLDPNPSLCLKSHNSSFYLAGS